MVRLAAQMKSMEKLEVLRTAGIDPKQAEAIVKTQEDSAYVSKDYLDARLRELETNLLNRLILAMLVITGVALGLAKFLL